MQNTITKKDLIISTLLILLFSCQDAGINNCSVNNPIEELTWLNTKISNIKTDTLLSAYFYFSTVEYRGNTVFVLEDCCLACNTIDLVYNCSGKAIGYISYNRNARPLILGGGETVVPIYYSDILKSKTILWKPDSLRCIPYPE